MATASILHADLDAFYASVEQRDDPRLRGRPVIVGGGVVLAASYEAKRCGVVTAMGAWQARALCPRAIIVPPRMQAYSEASKAVFEVFRDITPMVEPISIDEAFVDVAGLHRIDGPPVAIAQRLRRRVREEVGLPITVGVARTKFLAKVASGVAKPDGLLEVSPDAELEFLHPLAVDKLWGVGEVTAEKLRGYGIHTVGEVAVLAEDTLVSMLGPAQGRVLHALAHARSPERVVVGRRRGSIGSQRAIGRGPHTPEHIDATARAIVDRVTRRMRAAHRIGCTVVLRVRFGDYTRVTRSHSFPHGTASTAEVLAAVRALLASIGPLATERGLTLIGVSVANLDDDDIVQPPLPFDVPGIHAVDAALDHARDGVHEKFGADALRRAALLGRDQGFSVPRLPD